MLFLNLLLDLIHRLSHPISLPIDIANDLGLDIYGRVTLEELTQFLSQNSPSKLQKQMPKGSADALFTHALRKDIFQETSHFSYFFNQARLEFILTYDPQSCLKSATLHIQSKQEDLNLELQLQTSPYLWKQSLSL